MTKVVNGEVLIPHDGVTEWSVCGQCGTKIDWANDTVFGPDSGRDREDTSCPNCGSLDTAWLRFEDHELTREQTRNLDARMASRGWKKVGPGMYSPGDSLQEKLDQQRLEGVSREKLEAFIWKYSESQEQAESLIADMQQPPRGTPMIYDSYEEAAKAADRFREKHPEAADVRVEKSHGGYRAVFDHYASVGKKAACTTHVLSRTLLAQWKVFLIPELWEALDRDLTESEAMVIREATRPYLPNRWRFREKWFEGGRIYLVLEGKKTLVTSHCEE